MKLTESHLRNIIKQELTKSLPKTRLNEEVDRRVADCIEFALKFYPTLMSQVDMSTFEEKLNFLSARHGRLPRTWAILFAIELALNPSNTGDGRSGQIPFTDY